MNPSKTYNSLTKNFKEIIADRQKKIAVIDNEIALLQEKRNVLVKDIESCVMATKAFVKDKDFVEYILKESLSTLRSNMTIGDAMEAIIKSEGAQFQKDIITKVRNVGIRISDNAPYVVIGNAIRRDSKKRFKVLDNGRVTLRTEKEKADAKS